MMGEAKETKIFRPAQSSLFLEADSELTRLPRAPDRKRSRRFYAQFEGKALFYDCFWHPDNKNITLIGPPPLNLAPSFECAIFRAQPSGKVLKAQFSISRSVMSTELADVPQNTTHIQLEFAGFDFSVQVQPSLVKTLAGASILFTMNKDNDLTWIRDWAKYHIHHHHTDTIILFDNGSTRYGLDDLETALGGLAGLKNLVLFSWPFPYGPRDDRALSHHYWPLFLQISSMSVVLRRLGMAANGILNCDIDELVAPVPGRSIYEIARAAPHGLAALAGSWVEALSGGGDTQEGMPLRHRDFIHLRRDPTRLLCPKKWVLDPARNWVKNPEVFPYMHRIMGAPERKITEKPRGKFWHFRGINTNWKEQRIRTHKPAKPNQLLHFEDSKLREALVPVSND